MNLYHINISVDNGTPYTNYIATVRGSDEDEAVSNLKQYISALGYKMDILEIRHVNCGWKNSEMRKYIQETLFPEKLCIPRE